MVGYMSTTIRILADGKYEYLKHIQELWDKSISLLTSSSTTAPLTSLSSSSDLSGLLASRGFFRDLSSELLSLQNQPLHDGTISDHESNGQDDSRSLENQNTCLQCRSPISRPAMNELLPNILPPTSKATPAHGYDNLVVQHVVVYYRPEAVASCSECNSSYFRVLR